MRWRWHPVLLGCLYTMCVDVGKAGPWPTAKYGLKVLGCFASCLVPSLYFRTPTSQIAALLHTLYSGLSYFFVPLPIKYDCAPCIFYGRLLYFFIFLRHIFLCFWERKYARELFFFVFGEGISAILLGIWLHINIFCVFLHRIFRLPQGKKYIAFWCLRGGARLRPG